MKALRTVVGHTTRVDEDRIVHVCSSEDEIFQCPDIRRRIVENALIGKGDDLDGALIGSDLGQMVKYSVAGLDKFRR